MDSTASMTDEQIEDMIAHLMGRCPDDCPRCEAEFEELYLELGGES